MEKKQKPNWGMRVIILLFILYLSLSIAMESGYYEAKLNQKTTLTEESIEQFEKDVREGKNVDIKDYVVEKKRDFSNGATKTGVFLSSLVEDFMSEGITQMVNVLKKLFT
ncbi:MAG: hypothetical protein HFH86_01070 [Bacilli bacterium]|jgi:hypothetical protein|nr:hypothetical protein [Bacilli bacterium]